LASAAGAADAEDVTAAVKAAVMLTAVMMAKAVRRRRGMQKLLFVGELTIQCYLNTNLHDCIEAKIKLTPAVPQWTAPSFLGGRDYGKTDSRDLKEAASR
jgi:hypothetical protein